MGPAKNKTILVSLIQENKGEGINHQPEQEITQQILPEKNNKKGPFLWPLYLPPLNT